MLMGSAMDSELGGTVNPEMDLSCLKKQRFPDDETNRHGMKLKQSPYFQSLMSTTMLCAQWNRQKGGRSHAVFQLQNDYDH